MAIKSFKTRIYPTAKQRDYLNQAFGVRRFAWNWIWHTYFDENNKKLKATFVLQKLFNNTVALKPDKKVWLDNVNSMFRQEAFKDFGLAIKRWYDAMAVSKKTGAPTLVGPPRPKKKGVEPDSARIIRKGDSDFKILSSHKFSTVGTRKSGRQVYKVAESLSFLKTATIKTCTFTRVGDAYYMALTYEKTNLSKKTAKNGTVGIDLGVKTSVAMFDGTNFEKVGLPKTLKHAQKRIEKLERRLSRSVKNSKRWLRKKKRVTKSFAREASIKKDAREKLTTRLADSFNLIKIDDFNFEGAKNLKHCNRKLYNVSPYAFKLRLEQKATEHGSIVFYLPKFTPSSKTCSHCGNAQMMKLSERVYRCPHCGLVLDRDLNSAVFAYNY